MIGHTALGIPAKPRPGGIDEETTGEQPIEDLLPLIKQNPRRFRPVASVNPHPHPHPHHPIDAELERQIGLVSDTRSIRVEVRVERFPERSGPRPIGGRHARGGR